ncbi:MAG: DUF2971 domain-containing protein [Prevotella conceptionensis]|jgi:hypothetical protein
MNDSQEFIHGYNVVLDWLKKYEEEQGIKENRLSEIWDNYLENHTKEEFNSLFIEKLYKEEHIPYVIAFSKNGDSLPLWSMYGVDGKGVSLGFQDYFLYIRDFKSTEDFKIKSESEIDVLDVMYQNAPNLDELRTNALKSQYKQYLEEANKNNREHLLRVQMKHLGIATIIVSPYIKHPAYAFEEEKRLAIYKRDEDKVLYKINSKGNMISYIETPIPKKNLRSITIGPCVDFVSTKRVLEQQLDKHEFKNVEIRQSEIPYRQF